MIACMGQEKETDWKEARKNFLGDEHVLLSWSGWCFTNTFLSPQKFSELRICDFTIYELHCWHFLKSKQTRKIFVSLRLWKPVLSFKPVHTSMLSCTLKEKISSLCPASSIFFFPFIPKILNHTYISKYYLPTPHDS